MFITYIGLAYIVVGLAYIVVGLSTREVKLKVPPKFVNKYFVRTITLGGIVLV
jgi:hypothetical protein